MRSSRQCGRSLASKKATPDSDRARAPGAPGSGSGVGFLVIFRRRSSRDFGPETWENSSKAFAPELAPNRPDSSYNQCRVCRKTSLMPFLGYGFGFAWSSPARKLRRDREARVVKIRIHRFRADFCRVASPTLLRGGGVGGCEGGWVRISLRVAPPVIANQTRKLLPPAAVAVIADACQNSRLERAESIAAF